ncbi:MAG: 3-hydroxyacyl-CoA dehydrogenase/enoyl-CoA hydratase family protein [Saprospiraceae bacterium]|nr:3-hydroxyacyl-CoA dehydrogenase/enoyl-CoA hydratase family protein [Saprospiraceae bacterium]
MKSLLNIGIVGAGTMGSAIAQKCAQEGFKVLLADRHAEIIRKGIEQISKSLNEAVDRNILTNEEMDKVLKNIIVADKLEKLSECNLVIEAIYENLTAKKELFATLNKIVSSSCILATNTSSFSVSELSEMVDNQDRFIGLHFFYHAAKNRLLEIIPGKFTSDQTTNTCKEFATYLGKDVVLSKDQYGFAVNRFFVPWLNEAVRIYEEKIATKEEIDKICEDAFGIGIGPFALMNATGIGVAYHSQKTLEVFGNLYKPSDLLKIQADSGHSWNLNSDFLHPINLEIVESVAKRLWAVVFFVCNEILQEKICSPAHLNRGAKVGLKWKKGPVEKMRLLIIEEVNSIISSIAEKYSMIKTRSLRPEDLEIEYLQCSVKDDHAIISFDQPEALNPLNVEMVKALQYNFNLLENNPEIKKIFITGSGKAFVAGADIKFFLQRMKSNRIEEIESFTRFTQKVFNDLENSRIKIVMILNGYTMGGGLELALCGDILLALPNARFAFPETGIGIYPALGGTQRSVRRIGTGLSKYLILTGKVLNATEALEIGLVDGVISQEDAFELMKCKTPLPEVQSRNLNERWIQISDFFEHNSLEKIQNTISAQQISENDGIYEIVKAISEKAPRAIHFADQLIDEKKGCESEIEHLKNIFSTEDAFTGLSSIGKKVHFIGK